MRLAPFILSASLLYSQLSLARVGSVDELRLRQLPNYCADNSAGKINNLCIELQAFVDSQRKSSSEDVFNFISDFNNYTFQENLKNHALAKLLEKRYRNLKLFPGLDMNLVDSKFAGCFKSDPLKKYANDLDKDLKKSSSVAADQDDFLAGILLNTLRAEAGWSNRKDTNKKIDDLVEKREEQRKCFEGNPLRMGGSEGFMLKPECSAPGLDWKAPTKVKAYFKKEHEKINERLTVLNEERAIFNKSVLSDPLLVESTSFYQKGDFQRTPLMQAALSIFDQAERDALGSAAPEVETLSFTDWTFSKFDAATNRTLDRFRGDSNLVGKMKGMFLSESMGEGARKKSTAELSEMLGLDNNDNSLKAQALRAVGLKELLKEQLKKNPSQKKQLLKIAKEQLKKQGENTAEAMEEICDENGKGLHHYQDLVDEVKRQGALSVISSGGDPVAWMKQFNETHCKRHSEDPIDDSSMTPLLVGAGLFVGAGICVLGAAFTMGGSCAAAGALMTAGGAVFAGYGVYETLQANRVSDIGKGLVEVNLADLDKVRRDISNYRMAASMVGVDAALAPFAVLTGGTKLIRMVRAQKVLDRKLTPKEKDAIWRAHKVGQGQKGADGGAAGLGNYTQAQLREKSRILKEAIPDAAERRKLMEAEITGGSDNPFAEFFKAMVAKADKGEKMTPEEVEMFKKAQDYTAEMYRKANPPKSKPKLSDAQLEARRKARLEKSKKELEALVVQMEKMADDIPTPDVDLSDVNDITDFVERRMSRIIVNVDSMMMKPMLPQRAEKVLATIDAEIKMAKEGKVSEQRVAELERLRKRFSAYADDNAADFKYKKDLDKAARERENAEIAGSVARAEEPSAEDIAIAQKYQQEVLDAQKAKEDAIIQRKVAQAKEDARKKRETEEARAEFQKYEREYLEKRAAEKAKAAEEALQQKAREATEGLPESFTTEYAQILRNGDKYTPSEYVTFSQQNPKILKHIVNSCNKYGDNAEACIDIMLSKTMSQRK